MHSLSQRILLMVTAVWWLSTAAILRNFRPRTARHPLCPLPPGGRGVEAMATWERAERKDGSNRPGHAGAFEEGVVDAPW